MRKKELIKVIAEETNLPERTVRKVMNTFVDVATKLLAEGEKVTLTGFGTFCMAETKPRKGRNPRTGETIEIPARRVVRFRKGKLLKDIETNA